MEKHPNPFDEFLKETLKGHQMTPPEEAKKAFLKEASAIITTRKGWTNWYYIPLLVILVIGIIVVIYYQRSDKPVSSVPIFTENLSQVSISDSSSLTSNASTSTKINSSSLKTSLSTENKQITSDSLVPSENKTSTESKSSFVTAALPVTGDANKAKQEIRSGNATQSNVRAALSIQINLSGNDTIFSNASSSKPELDSLSKNVTAITDSISQPVTEPAAEKPPLVGPESQETPKPVVANQTPYFTAGVYYLPEWMFNIIEGTKYVNNFGFEATFHRGPISIQTGAGISVSKGITKNTVEYNDYLGTYAKLDSITFAFNESEHNFIPNLYMSSQKVWDSLTQLDSTQVIKRYTYLQVPLVLGFDFWQKGIFSVGVRVGTILSLQLNSKQLSGEYNPGQNQIIAVNRLSPDQVSLNLQAIGGINASARLRKNIVFEIEPQARYYYQSIYEESDLTKKPWSVGIRTAVLYKF